MIGDNDSFNLLIDLRNLDGDEDKIGMYIGRGLGIWMGIVASILT